MNVPFAFARRHGVFIANAGGEESDDAIVFRPGAPIAAVAEAQRVLGHPASLRRLRDDEFERQLQSTYERGAQDNEAVMAGFDEALDLAEIAEGLREPADLLAKGYDGGELPEGGVMFGGAPGAIGGIRPAGIFRFELHDPVLGRSLGHSYRIETMPMPG